MKKTFISCLLITVAAASFAQQDYTEVPGNEMEYGMDNRPGYLNQFDNYMLPKNGSVSQQLNNKPLFIVSVKNNKLHGDWQSWYQNGLPCDSGNLVKGLPDGVWKHWDVNGNLIAVRNYSSDKYHRIKNEMIRYHPRKVAFPLSVLYQQNKRAALKYMHASYSFAAAAQKKSDQSLPELVAANITPGNAYKPVFDHGLHHGVFVNFFPAGLAKDSGHYKDGLRDGLWVHRDTAEKTTLKGAYVHGIRVKEWKAYDESGRLKEVMFYNQKGQLKWRKKFQRTAGYRGSA